MMIFLMCTIYNVVMLSFGEVSSSLAVLLFLMLLLFLVLLLLLLLMIYFLMLLFLLLLLFVLLLMMVCGGVGDMCSESCGFCIYLDLMSDNLICCCDVICFDYGDCCGDVGGCCLLFGKLNVNVCVRLWVVVWSRVSGWWR